MTEDARQTRKIDPPTANGGEDAPLKDASAVPAADVITADEVAALLRVDRKTVYAAVRSGSLPALRLRHVIRFSRRAVLGSLLGSTGSRSLRK